MKKSLSMRLILIIFVILASGFAAATSIVKGGPPPGRDFPSTPYGLEVTGLGKKYMPDINQMAIYQQQADQGGNTSVRNVNRDRLKWKNKGYFQRNRDLGQVFTATRDFRLDAIVLRTGPGDKAVLSGAPGSKVFIQFFNVTGTPHINNNGTPSGTKARHGFTSNHRADDIIEDVHYQSIAIARGGIFPDIPSTHHENHPVNGDAGRLYFMRWKLTGAPLKFKTGKQYAFMIGFDKPGKGRGFTLANSNAAAVNAPSSLGDAHDAYTGGWAIRREGNGTRPTMMLPDRKQPPANSKKLDKLFRESLFPQGKNRFMLSPTSNGYPDVDTYRDLQFALEVHDL